MGRRDRGCWDIDGVFVYAVLKPAFSFATFLMFVQDEKFERGARIEFAISWIDGRERRNELLRRRDMVSVLVRTVLLQSQFLL